METGGQCHAPAAIPPGKTPTWITGDLVLILQEDVWSCGPFWIGAENLDPSGFRTPNRPARTESLYRVR